MAVAVKITGWIKSVDGGKKKVTKERNGRKFTATRASRSCYFPHLTLIHNVCLHSMFSLLPLLILVRGCVRLGRMG